MPVNIIAAVALNGAIGKSNALMWHIRGDMLFFKETTLGHPVIMGRKTYESLGRPLPGRLNIIITRSGVALPENAADTVVVSSLQKAVEKASEKDGECFVIGGGQIYSEAMAIADSLYITRVFLSPDDADTFFPAINAGDWEISEQGEIQTDQQSGIMYRFEKYIRSRD